MLICSGIDLLKMQSIQEVITAMKKDKKFTSLLLIAAMLVSMVFLTACFGADDGDDAEPSDLNDEAMILALNLESDSDNGVEWDFEQDKELFDCEYVFLGNEGDDGEESEEQAFTLRPVKPGDVKISFENKTTETTYTYNCHISDDLTDIAVTGSEGESAGSAVEPPNVVLERN